MEGSNLSSHGPFEDQHHHLHPEHSPDHRAIHYGIMAAEANGREIDDGTARRIAAQLHGGQASALYSLASTGNIDEQRIYQEIGEEFEWQRDPHVREWVNWLGTYCIRREHKGTVAGWYETTADTPVIEPPQVGALAVGHQESGEADDEAAERAALVARINAAAVTALGQVAIILTGGATGDEQHGQQALADRPTGRATDRRAPERQAEARSLWGNEPALIVENDQDDIPWRDAARWSPDLEDHDDLAPDQLNVLFGEVPHEEIGTVEDIGWFGLLRHDGRPGGVVLHQNHYGFRDTWQTGSDEELRDRWEQLQREYDAFTKATRAHGREDDQADNEQGQKRGIGHDPEIWVGSWSDYNAGRLHGVWLDATLDPDELRDAVGFMLRNGYTPGAEEWGIFDYDGFGGLRLGEYESLETVSRIAKGIEAYGPAFGAWAEYVGTGSHEQLNRFEDQFQGEHESMEAYVEEILSETGFYRDLDEALKIIPEDLRRYVSVDVQGLARDWGIEMHVVETANGRMWVFSTR